MGLRPLYEMWARVSVKKTVKGGDILSTLSKERYQIISYFYSVLRFYDQCLFVALVMSQFPFKQNLNRAKNISGPDLFQDKVVKAVWKTVDLNFCLRNVERISKIQHIQISPFSFYMRICMVNMI